MAQTKQGTFETKYHHIDAPTVQDEEYGRQFKKRRLIVPIRNEKKGYCSPLIGYIANLPWSWSRKLDGENIRIQWNGEQALWNGKTNAFQCSGDFTEYMNNTFIEEIFEEKFGREKIVTLFGEKMGPKTQGNELGLEKDEVVLFDVSINGTWLSRENVAEIAKYFGLKTPKDYMDMGVPLTLQEMISLVAEGEFKDWEGIVAVPWEEMRDQAGHRVIVKIKNKDYLRESA